MTRLSTAVTITDPLVKYRALVAAGVCSPCPAQHRLARHLHRIYLRIKDYSPQAAHRHRLHHVSLLAERGARDDEDRDRHKDEVNDKDHRDGGLLALPHHAIWRNPLFRHLLPGREGRDSVALTRVLTDHQAAMEMDSPRGLFLSGEVGTGKSMLLRLLADGLPTAGKAQWHFNTFMLHTFAQLDTHRSATATATASASAARSQAQAPAQDPEYSLLWMARKLASESPVLFLDEFQLPDRAAAKILSHLFIAFFQLDDADNLEASGADHADSKKPRHYHLLGAGDDGEFDRQVIQAVSRTGSSAIPWQPSEVVVYGRKVLTPRHHEGFVLWDFADLVASFGPADYITMASSYHTFVIDRVPVLTVLSKNEARRFITLLDALYESRCKLVIRAEAGPDELFFPDSSPSSKPSSPPSTSSSSSSTSSSSKVDTSHGDATYSETVAEVYQDSTAPFRPNVSLYDTGASTSRYDPDQDSDFGLAHKSVDFRDSGAFTGEDERFAYRRAASRLWELCSARWHAREGDWWRPLPLAARHWEGGAASRPLRERRLEGGRGRGRGGEEMGESVAMDEVAGLARWRVEDLRKGDGSQY